MDRSSVLCRRTRVLSKLVGSPLPRVPRGFGYFSISENGLSSVLETLATGNLTETVWSGHRSRPDLMFYLISFYVPNLYNSIPLTSLVFFFLKGSQQRLVISI